MTDRPIAEIPKNSREVLRVSLGEYQGHHLLNARIWFRADDGTMRPSQKGVSVPLRILPDFAEATTAALREARRSGLLKAGDILPFGRAEVIEDCREQDT